MLERRMSDLREALARLLQEAEQQVGHEALCDLMKADCGYPRLMRCTCDYAQRVRERQAAVMEAAVRKALDYCGEFPQDGIAAALAAGQAHLQEDK